MADFIGKAALQHIADNYSSQIIMGAAHFRPEELDRMGIKITTGLQFKDTITVMNRKGGTTRRGASLGRKAYLEQVLGQSGFLHRNAVSGAWLC